MNKLNRESVMKEKILIVEDNSQNMRMIEMILERDYTVLKAIDGEEAIEIAVREQPRLILMDIQLPGMSGLETTMRLRAIPAFSTTPIIGLTAYAMKGDREAVIQSGCDDYLSKPFDTRTLPGLVAGHLKTNGS